MRARSLEALLRAEGQVEPPAGLEDRLWMTLIDKLAQDVPPASSGEVSPDTPWRRLLSKSLLKGPVGLALLLVAGALASGIAGAEHVSPRGLEEEVQAHELLFPETRIELPDVSPEPLVEAKPSMRPKASRPHRRPGDAQASAPLAATSVARSELAVLRAIRDAVRRGDLHAALAEIATHQQAFGDAGQLVQERLAYHVEVLCALGRKDAAQALATEFVARWPESAHRPRVETSCR